MTRSGTRSVARALTARLVVHGWDEATAGLAAHWALTHGMDADAWDEVAPHLAAVLRPYWAELHARVGDGLHLTPATAAAVSATITAHAVEGIALLELDDDAERGEWTG